MKGRIQGGGHGGYDPSLNKKKLYRKIHYFLIYIYIHIKCEFFFHTSLSDTFTTSFLYGNAGNRQLLVFKKKLIFFQRTKSNNVSHFSINHLLILPTAFS